MVGSLLEIARLEDGAIPLRLVRTDLRQLADAALGGLAGLA